jgi:hypothetical protein
MLRVIPKFDFRKKAMKNCTKKAVIKSTAPIFPLPVQFLKTTFPFSGMAR